MYKMYKNSTMFGAASSGYGSKCCPLAVDPYSVCYTWIALIGGIALATFFLRWSASSEYEMMVDIFF